MSLKNILKIFTNVNTNTNTGYPNLTMSHLNQDKFLDKINAQEAWDIAIELQEERIADVQVTMDAETARLKKLKSISAEDYLEALKAQLTVPKEAKK